jgi:serine/threonine protein kinase
MSLTRLKTFARFQPEESVGREAVDLISVLLQYKPNERLSAIKAMSHSFFDQLRDPQTRLSNSRELPNLFDFSKHGMIDADAHDVMTRIADLE